MKAKLPMVIAGMALLMISAFCLTTLAAPSVLLAPSPTPTPCILCQIMATGSATPSAVATRTPLAAVPTPKPRPLPFKSIVVSVNKEAGTFRMGKKKIRVVHLTPMTKLSRIDGSPATVDDLSGGVEVRGSLRKRDDGEFDAVSLKVGSKTLAIPAASASPAEPEEGF